MTRRASLGPVIRNFGPERLLERFEDKVIPEPNSGCHIWTGCCKKPFGYGSFRSGEDVMAAHRFSWIAYRGPIIDDLCVLHRCDTPACVNPDHLFLGTHAENNEDMVKKGRNVRRPALNRGEHNGSAKLTRRQIMAIREDPRRSPMILAEEYGVSKSTIWLIRTNRTWI